MSKTQAKLTILIDLADQLRRDEALPNQELRSRDRHIGRRLAQTAAHPRRQLARWLEEVRTPDADSPGRTYGRMQYAGTLLLAVLGLLAGWGAAAAVFYYDGEDPVNVVNVLAIFVFLQLGMLVLLMITLLPSRLLRMLPGARAIQETLRVLNPGRLRNLAGRFIPRSQRRSMTRVLGSGKTHRTLYGRVERWGMVVASQWFAVMFNVGALAAAMALVTFSDLAFSWSTTLDIDAARLHRVTSTLAWPWARIYPDADPSIDLIRYSRHYRLDESEASSYDPTLLAGWWRFLVLCMTCYGLTPRLLTVLIATWRLRAAVDRAMLQIPGVSGLLDRLNHELVETASDDPDLGAKPASDTALGDAPAAAAYGAYALVDWSQVASSVHALREWATCQWGTPPGEVFAAGGAQSLSEDTEVIEELAARSNRSPVLVAVKAWEPPVADCIDFLRALRSRLGEGWEVQVIPVSRAPDGTFGAPGERHFAAWQDRLQQVGDPWLSARQLAAGNGQ